MIKVIQMFKLIKTSEFEHSLKDDYFVFEAECCYNVKNWIDVFLEFLGIKVVEKDDFNQRKKFSYERKPYNIEGETWGLFYNKYDDSFAIKNQTAEIKFERIDRQLLGNKKIRIVYDNYNNKNDSLNRIFELLKNSISEFEE